MKNLKKKNGYYLDMLQGNLEDFLQNLFKKKEIGCKNIEIMLGSL